MEWNDLTRTERDGADAADAVLAFYESVYIERVPSGDVPSSWLGLETVGAVIADLMHYCTATDVEFVEALAVALELTFAEAVPAEFRQAASQ